MIVVTTPTGNIGSKVVEELVNAHEAVRVVARNPSHLSASVRDQVEMVEGSHGDAAVIDKALEGATALFWLVPPNPHAQSMELPMSISRGRPSRRSGATVSAVSLT